MFGYGLYMYDLQSLKLTEAESKVRRLERSEHSQSSELKQLKNAKNELEEKLKKVCNFYPKLFVPKIFDILKMILGEA